MGWLCRKWHTECPGTPLSSLPQQGKSDQGLCWVTLPTRANLSTKLTSNYPKHCSLPLPPLFLFSLNLKSTQKPKKKHSFHLCLLHIKQPAFLSWPGSLETIKKNLSVVVKRHKSSSVYCFFSPFIQHRAKGLCCQPEQVWLGDDLHLHQISPAPPGWVGCLTRLFHRPTITTCKAICAQSLGNCELLGFSNS